MADILKLFSDDQQPCILTVLPALCIAWFLGISGAKLYGYGNGASNIGGAIYTSIFALIAIVGVQGLQKENGPS